MRTATASSPPTRSTSPSSPASPRTNRWVRRRSVRGVGLIPSASYSITVRLQVPADGLPASQLTAAVESAGGMVTAFDVTAVRGDFLQVDLTCASPDADHADQITKALAAVEGVTVGKVSDRTFLLHLGGKIEVQSKVPLKT